MSLPVRSKENPDRHWLFKPHEPHPESPQGLYVQGMNEAKQAEIKKGFFRSIIVSLPATKIHDWMEMVIGGLEHFILVEKPYMQNIMEREPIGTDNFIKYMLEVTEA